MWWFCGGLGGYVRFVAVWVFWSLRVVVGSNVCSIVGVGCFMSVLGVWSVVSDMSVFVRISE